MPNRSERAIVSQNVDEVKTAESGKEMPLDAELLNVPKRGMDRLSSPVPRTGSLHLRVQLGRKPWSYDQIWRVYQKAAKTAQIQAFGTHTLRHTYRSWLDAVGTGLAVQQKLMRHSDIRTTMNYGDVVMNEMEQAHGEVVNLALGGFHNGFQQL